jgi:hypothetical protein
VTKRGKPTKVFTEAWANKQAKAKAIVRCGRAEVRCFHAVAP